MKINKDGKTLYFGDEEIDNNTDGEKKVFVTKRINGKESHVKTEKKKKQTHEVDIINDDEIFSFKDEFVLGIKSEKEDKKGTKKQKKNKKNEQRNRNEENTVEVKRRKENTRENKNKQNPINDQTIENTKKTKRKKSKKNIQNIKKDNLDKFENETINKKKKSKKKRKISNKLFVGIFSAILLIVVIIVIALMAPIFNIKEIDVSGNEQISTDTIISLSGLKKEENIFRFNSSINEKIKENPYVDTVKVERKLPGTVKIFITERAVKYQVNVINSYTYIDKEGYILENSSVKKDVPVLVGLDTSEDDLINGKRLITSDLEKLNNVIKILDASKAIDIENLITEINVEDKNDCILYLESEGKKVYIGDTTNLTNKMLYTKTILENEKGKTGIAFVNSDINSGFKPYFREE